MGRVWVPKVGDVVQGSWGCAKIVAIFPESDGQMVQLAYPTPDRMSTTERVVGLYQTMYGLSMDKRGG